jgi:hypothetical protein
VRTGHWLSLFGRGLSASASGEIRFELARDNF